MVDCDKKRNKKGKKITASNHCGKNYNKSKLNKKVFSVSFENKIH